jgi:hypothetical protein
MALRKSIRLSIDAFSRESSAMIRSPNAGRLGIKPSDIGIHVPKHPVTDDLRNEACQETPIIVNPRWSGLEASSTGTEIVLGSGRDAWWNREESGVIAA